MIVRSTDRGATRRLQICLLRVDQVTDPSARVSVRGREQSRVGAPMRTSALIQPVSDFWAVPPRAGHCASLSAWGGVFICSIT